MFRSLRPSRATAARGLAALALGVSALCASPARAAAQQASAGSARPSPVRFRADAGFLAVLQHDLQQGEPGSRFDYRDEGGQDVLFFVSRYNVWVDLAERHRVSLLYQPLELRTRERLRRDLLIDGQTYPAGQDLEFRYGFPFYRATYEYTAWQSERTRLGLGGGLQIRNATIEFSESDGERLVSERDVGPVPLLHLGLWRRLSDLYWLEAEVDGIYAPIKYLNGDDNGVEGALLDANLRVGIDASEHVGAFLNLRYLGGGAEGAGDGGDLAEYTSNWLQFLVLSVGAELR